MASDEITICVHLDMELNGEPITRVLTMPASVEPIGEREGLHVHLDLDAHKLAEALLPHLVRMIRARTGLNDE